MLAEAEKSLHMPRATSRIECADASDATSRLCFARRHMAPAVNAFYAYALSISKKSGIFYSDARRDAWEFQVNKDSVTKWTRYLESRGWLKRVDRGPRLRRNLLTGTYQSIRYEVRTHDDWAKSHPGQCRFPVGTLLSENTGQEIQPPVRKNRAACPNSTPPPVRKFRTKSERKLEKNHSNHHPTDDDDDDSPDGAPKSEAGETSKPNPENQNPPVEEKQTRRDPAERQAGFVATAKARIVAAYRQTCERIGQQLDGSTIEMIDEVLSIVIQRAEDSGKTPNSAEYFEVGFENYMTEWQCKEAEQDQDNQDEAHADQPDSYGAGIPEQPGHQDDAGEPAHKSPIADDHEETIIEDSCEPGQFREGQRVKHPCEGRGVVREVLDGGRRVRIALYGRSREGGSVTNPLVVSPRVRKRLRPRIGHYRFRARKSRLRDTAG